MAFVETDWCVNNIEKQNRKRQDGRNAHKQDSVY